ncbi:MAG TPA: hypothetical protein VFM46_08455 [Pseudomonadales bacterium]|nr:hypothetical protein [Pseudomonadales bacterium]
MKQWVAVGEWMSSWRALTCVGLAMALSSCAGLGGKRASDGYECGPATGNARCQSQVQVGARVTGIRSLVSVAERMSPGDGFVSNEVMLQNSERKKGWIKVGYKVGPHGGLNYFWSALFPDEGIIEEYGIAVVPAAEVGKTVEMDIHQVDANLFSVTLKGAVTNYSTEVKIRLWSTDQAGTALMGQQLAGAKGASATRALFTDTQLYSGEKTRFISAADVVGATEKTQTPPFGEWLKLPAENNRGGEYVVQCCDE